MTTFSTSNAVVVGGATKKSQYDTVFDNTQHLREVLKGDTDLGAAWEASGQNIQLQNASVAHGMTGVVATDVYGRLKPNTTTDGTLQIEGFSDADQWGIVVWGTNGSSGTANTKPPLSFYGSKKSGTGRTAIATTDMLAEFTNDGAQRVMIYGDGGVAVRDRDFRLEYNGGSSNLPTLHVDSSDDSFGYIRDQNTFQFQIASLVEMYVAPTGVRILDGLQVGFNGTPTADTIAVGSTALSISAASTDYPAVYFDTNDSIRYTRSGNTFDVVVDSTNMFSVNGDGFYSFFGASINLGGNGNLNLHGLDLSTGATFQGATRFIRIANAATTASLGNPNGAGFLFASSGALMWHGSAGTVTTVAPA